jgi:hypothetical protein
MKEEFENTENVVPIERGIEIREENLSSEQDSLEEELQLLHKQLAEVNKQISEELQTVHDDKTEGIVHALTKKHSFLKEREEELLREQAFYDKEGDALAEQSMRLKEHREKQN